MPREHCPYVTTRRFACFFNSPIVVRLGSDMLLLKQATIRQIITLPCCPGRFPETNTTVYQRCTQHKQERTCGDPQAGANGVQRAVKLVRGDVGQAMLLCPFLPHVARRLEGGLPIYTRAAA